MRTLLAALLTCASAAHAGEPITPRYGVAIAGVSQRLLRVTPALARDDCSGLVEHVLDRAGVKKRGSTASFFATTQALGWQHTDPVPSPGDLVFFDGTYDKNGDGRAGDRLTHIAVVAQVEGDGTVVMLHRSSSKGVTSLRMNLRSPDVHREGDRVLNSYLVRSGYGDPNRRFASHTFRAFATIGGRSKAAASDSAMPSSAPIAVPWTPPQGEATSVHTRLGKLLRGRRLRKSELQEASCGELWFLRNAAYARHGYVFQTEQGRAAFAGEHWYRADPAMTPERARRALSRADGVSVGRVMEREEALACPLRTGT